MSSKSLSSHPKLRAISTVLILVPFFFYFTVIVIGLFTGWQITTAMDKSAIGSLLLVLLHLMMIFGAVLRMIVVIREKKV